MYYDNICSETSQVKESLDHVLMQLQKSVADERHLQHLLSSERRQSKAAMDIAKEETMRERKRNLDLKQDLSTLREKLVWSEESKKVCLR